MNLGARSASILLTAGILWLRLALSNSLSMDNNASVVGRRERTVVLLYHKPADVVTTHATDDPLGRRNVYDDIYSMRGFRGGGRRGEAESSVASFSSATGIYSGRLESFGRLDADTTGLLLLTNDGGLLHHVTNKNSKSSIASGGPITKTYQAVIMGYHEESSQMLLDMATKGVDIGAKYGGMTLPALKVAVLAHPSSKSTFVSITLMEGRNRQVRRMFHSQHSGVIHLKRTHVGAISLGDLEPGEWRILTDEEVVNGLFWRPRVLVHELVRRRRRRSQ
jgi:pseudouridine synthase